MSTALLLTLDQFLARPERDDGQREELIQGELIVSPGAKVSHAYIVEQLRESLRPLKQQSFIVSNDFSCILRPDSMPVPDLAVVSLPRWLAAAQSDSWLDGAPELVIEVSSPSNRKLYHKAVIYLEHAAEQVWVVDPKERSVTVYTTDRITELGLGEKLDFHCVTVPVHDLFLPQPSQA